MVLINVDFPRPVWPAPAINSAHPREEMNERHTNANDIELKATLQELPFYLGGDAVETNVALGEYRTLLRRHCVRSSHDY